MLQELGAAPGQTVTLYMQNSPEIIFAWLAIWSLGCCAAFINYNLAGDALLHTWKMASSKILIVDVSLEESVQQLRTTLAPGAIIQVVDEATLARIDASPVVVPSDDLAATVELDDDAVLMYTRSVSGLYSTFCDV